MYAPLYFEIPTPTLGSALSDCGPHPQRKGYDDSESYRSDIVDYNACRREALHPAPAPVAALAPSPVPVIYPLLSPVAATPAPALTTAIQNAAATGTVPPTPAAPTGFSLASLETWLQNSTTLFGFLIPNWALAGGGALLAFSVLGGSGRRR